jgi:hypothetical protein
MSSIHTGTCTYNFLAVVLFLRKKKELKPPASKKEQRRKNPHRHKPEEQEGIPQHRHYPLTKHREDENPNCHEEHKKDVARLLAAQPPKPVESEQK